MKDGPHRSISLSPGKLAALVCLVVMLGLNLVNIGNPILERHGFRQTQTAITAYYLRENGVSLDYETPVLGQPWSVPFEFPVYQAIVAAAWAGSGLSLDVVGRLVSLAFAVLCIFPIFRGLRHLGFGGDTPYYGVALYLAAPVYLFWSGTFMIESAALFFTLMFLYLSLKIIEGEDSWATVVACGAFLALALLQKITTALVPLALVACVFLYRLSRDGLGAIRGVQFRGSVALGIAKLTVAFVVPTLIALAWVMYSDSVKALNPIGRELTSSVLSAWNYGSLEQRFSARLWLGVVLGRIVGPNAGLLAGSMLVAYAAWHGEPRTRGALLFLLAAFLLPFLVFTNLHVVHDYYQSANAVYWMLALAIAVQATRERLAVSAPWAGGVVLVLLVASCLAAFSSSYASSKLTPLWPGYRPLAVAEYIARYAGKDEAVIVNGLDWSSEVPYYAGRKALMIPKWGDTYADAVSNSGKYLQVPVALIVNCGGRNAAAIAAQVAQRHGIDQPNDVIAGCDVYSLRRRAGAGAPSPIE